MDYPGLDDAYLRYIQATPENQRRIQSFYLPFFKDRSGPLADLAFGHGDFMQLLTEQGIAVVGVDTDGDCCAEARRRGLTVVQSDVLDYLRQAAEDSLDGIFSAHLIEHLTYPSVMELIRLSYRALKPSGILLLVTPNVRSLYPHLESFYMHFGHVTFYHPKLLGFFLSYFGFRDARAGENPRMALPLWREAPWPAPAAYGAAGQATRLGPVRYDPALPSTQPGIVGRLIGGVKAFATRLIVQPLLDRVVEQVNRRLIYLEASVETARKQLTSLNGSVECYVYATKGETTLNLPAECVGERL
ncbi:MAG TPA: class I SAM-dependent methyltransferase [Anaerolineae bacterium]|nr:class I SAM-dependent methyltransferase [Anaerolineae bacterium]